MSITVFTGSLAKIERANEHIDDLGDRITAFLETDFYRLYVEHDPHVGQEALVFEADTMPGTLGPLVGDIVHNLRSPLDLMFHKLVLLVGGTPTRRTYFPFRQKREELVGELASGPIKAADQSIIDLIVDTIKPYRGGNDILYAVNDMDIADKHMSLIPVMSVSALQGVCGSGGGITVTDCALMIRGQGGSGKLKAIGMPIGTGFEITDKGRPTVDVVFGEGQPFEGQSVLPTLKGLSQVVTCVIEDIEKAYLATV